MDNKFESVFGDNKLKILVIFLLCISFSEAHNFWKFPSYNSTLSRVKRQNCGFNCANGDCISTDNVCDGTVECKDGSDETEKMCSALPCPSFLFKCNYGACINKEKLCNGIKDCADNSDETGQGCTTGSSACSPTEFRCQNDECINAFLVCDGRKDCSDGSDETVDSCRGNVCASFLIKCNYGACVDKNSRCNGIKECADGSDEFGCDSTPPVTSVVVPVTTVVVPVTPSTGGDVPDGGCRLLNHPPNGQRYFPTGRKYVPNDPVDKGTSITVKCNPGYRPTNLIGGGVAYCINGKWLGDTSDNVCYKGCPPLIDSTFVAHCTRGSQSVNCSAAIEGTVANVECKNFYTYGVRKTKTTQCSAGQWYPNVGSCDAECGLKRVNAQTLIIGGSQAQPGEYPWIVAIYDNTNTHICGGSIISTRFVVSAAHCFSNLDNGDVFDKEGYTLIAGKFHRDINDDRDKGTQQVRKIEKLIVHEDYRGRIRNYQYDISLIKLNEDLVLGLQVQPVCLDYDHRYEDISLTDGNKGVVAGWGYTSEGSDPAAELKKVILPVQNQAKCKEHLPKDFYDIFYTPDKICAGYVDQATTVCSGDSGGGFYFQSDVKFYIRGIVSLSPSSKVGCSKNLYALYTKVSSYDKWLERTMYSGNI
nr:modular serine protease-like [Onthophagus taurus]